MVARTGIVDLGSQGGKYTWFQKSTSVGGGCSLKRARLDRALASIDWRMIHPSAITNVLSAATSDHRPILLDTEGGANCGKSMFKYELMWGRDPKCHWVVKNAWKDKLHQNPMINIYRKLKRTKEHLSKWNRAHFRLIGNQVSDARSTLQQLESRDFVNGDELAKARDNLNEALAREEIFWRQKSRVKWLQQGDRCTKFFMATTVIRRRRNYIQQVRKEDGSWERNPNCITKMFIERFNNTFIDKKTTPLPVLSWLEEWNISSHENELLKAIPSEKEIEMCIRSMGQDRAPGPDGMSTGFYIQHWPTVQRDVFDMAIHFFRNFELPHCINNTNIVLIPKKDCPSGVNDYRPIALCNVAYKCISRILALRLRSLLPAIISPAQTTFVKGRLIAENTAVAKEIVHSMRKKRGKKGFMMIKLDMEKAYDKMSWNFILEVLEIMKFDITFIRWVKLCIEVQRMGLLLNGTVQGVISPSCGLRQGDPLSPALFIIEADVLSRLMAKNEAGKIAGFKFTRGGGAAITHLMFADDIILFGKASVKEANNFLKCFDEYCAWSGQAVNYHKSTVYFTQGVPGNKAQEIMNILGMKRMQNDSIYLGLPLFRSFKRSKDLNFLVDKVMQRVKSWKTRLLSKAGRACLIQSVASSLATYVAASDVIPKTIARKVDKELRDFWWGDTKAKKTFHTVDWSSLCQSKMRGGLGFRKIDTINSAFILKWGWKALTDKESVWGTIIQNKYLNHRNFFDVEINSRDSSFWKSILKSRSLLLNHVCRKIGNGKETSIWFDPWVPFANRSPTPLLDATHGVAWVNQFITEDGCWDEEMIKSWFNRADAKAILNIQLPRDDVKDDWLWMGEPSGLFSIKLACRFVKGENSATSVDPKWKMIWNSKVHPRLKLIWWQMERNAFPTRGKLACVMELNSICYPVCGEETETFFHLMWKCTYAKALWFNSSLGLRVELVDVHDWEQWKNWFLEDTNRPPNITFLEIMVIALCVMEAMWKERNSVVHGQSKNLIWQVLSNINRKIREQLHVVSNAVEDFCAWSPPPASWLCCNCDVSCDDEGMVLATVVRDDQGRIVTIKTERNHLTDPLIGEVVAVCMTAELMIDKKVVHVVFQSDNIETVKAFSNATDRDCNFKLVNLRSRFQQLCKGFQNWEVGHVPRRCNFMAHNIAKWARENSVTGIILCSDLTAEVLSDYVEWNKHAG
ncbi:uncharacterized protein LOC133038488 [Cannabis sativa]|uniref:uncharacterized protein LOC133038488 n=1 Tax=Cannabis sativa TaxID=3483 RepID=UPI0029CA523C|nr:uncharacterized protein LOC133038488 [Cannabis sativa]